VAYRKLRLQSRKKALESEQKDGRPGSYPFWMASIAAYLPEDDGSDMNLDIKYSKMERMEIRHYRVAGDPKPHWYDELSWMVFKHVTSKAWFETIVLCAILLVGATTGIELEAGENPSDDVVHLVSVVSVMSTFIFTSEIIMKVIAEGSRPLEFFTDQDNGKVTPDPIPRH
jgi:hypothetical protein